MMLWTFQTVAVCWTPVIHELSYGLLKSLWLSCRASEHNIRRSEFNFSWRLRIFSLSKAGDKTKMCLFLVLL